MATIEQNNAVFAKRLREFHRSPEGRALRDQIATARKELFKVYRQIALDHWKSCGNDASTGWGCEPEGPYQTKRKTADCAYELANTLTDYLCSDPEYALGSK